MSSSISRPARIQRVWYGCSGPESLGRREARFKTVYHRHKWPERDRRVERELDEIVLLRPLSRAGGVHLRSHAETADAGAG